MNKMVLVAIMDKKAEFFHPPYCIATQGMAIRGFGDAVMKGQSDLSAHPEDFTLFKLGEFDSQSGKITPCEPVSIATGLDFVKVGE